MSVRPLLRVVRAPPADALATTFAEIWCIGSAADLPTARALYAGDSGPEKSQAANILGCATSVITDGYTPLYAGADARDVNGARCNPHDPAARYWSLSGALWAVVEAMGPELFPNAPLVACMALHDEAQTRWPGLGEADESATKAEALDLLERAVRRLGRT